MAGHPALGKRRKKQPIDAIEQAKKDFGGLEERPIGALSIAELCRGLGIGHTAMREKMNKAVAEGVYEKLFVRARDARENLYRLPVYRKVVKKVSNAMDRVR